ncbi:Vps62-related protein [Hazenella sp. IB182353]|uniref:Vps62-related protein n=1 Tax=Polycladospora coralii TaxID=2771432 RepID=UPI001746B96B|nr:Vps62-related protein [Polycladospora coralii]MBS7529676.1 Vps62-related protein [Polycladospora coralii]
MRFLLIFSIVLTFSFFPLKVEGADHSDLESRLQHVQTIKSTQDNGKLTYSFTQVNTEIYNDRGTGSHSDVSIWYIRDFLPGWKSAGYFAQGSYNNPTGFVMGLKAEDVPGAAPILTDPIDFQFIWNDSGSGGQNDGSIWRPICKAGYVSLGSVATNHYSKPSLSSITCVRQDFTVEVNVGDLIWNDSGSGANSDVALYQIKSNLPYVLTSGSFYAQNNYSAPVGPVYGLRVQ